MFQKLKPVVILEAVCAFFKVFALNYFASGMSLFLSFGGAMGFVLLMGAWTGYWYNRYLKKQRGVKEEENSGIAERQESVRFPEFDSVRRTGNLKRTRLT